jgi:hypothetical protein
MAERNPPAIPFYRLPTPVARLLRLALQSREKKKKYDYVLTAWEVSVRLLVAADPPSDLALLSSPSLGHWVRAARVPSVVSSAPELCDLLLFLLETMDRKPRSAPRKVSASELLHLLPEYRNKATVAHAGPRLDSFYVRAFPLLQAGLAVAWAEGFFLPPGDRLVYVSDVELDTNGGHRARISSLEGPQSLPDGEGIPVPGGVLPQRVYLRRGDAYQPLFPWVVFRTHEIQEQVLLFNASNRGLVYLDCDTGELLDRKRLQESGIDVIDPISERPAERLGSFPEPVPPVEPVPPEEPGETPEGMEARESYRSVEKPPVRPLPPWRHLLPTASPRRWLALGGLSLALLAAGLLLFSRRELAPGDLLFLDRTGGEGWLARCSDHLKRGDTRYAAAACERAVKSARKSSATRARAASLLARVSCADRFKKPLPPGSLGVEVLVASAEEPLVLRWDPKRPEGDSLRLTSLTCAEIGRPSATADGQIWFHVNLPEERREQRMDWYLSAGDIEREDAPAALKQCAIARGGGSDDLVRSECGVAARTTKIEHLTRAARWLGEMHAAQNRPEEAIEWHLTALATLPPLEPGRQALGRSLEALCERSSRLKRAPGDPRTFKVVSWHWQHRTLAFKNEPAMNSPTMTKLFLPRGTCVLAGEIKETSESGRTNRWVDVEVDLPGAPFVRGWSHIDWLEPK